MGASASSNAGGEALGLGELPEGCAAGVLVHLSPLQICEVARLSRAFRGAASADCVWEAKLPRNYRFLASLIDAAAGVEAPTKNVSKKELYAMLTLPNPFDGGTKEFWIEKATAAVCMAISTKGLVITGIDDRRYWSHIFIDASRFQSVAYLQQIWWLEVSGEVDFCFPAGTYSLFFRLHLGRPNKWLGRWTYSTEHVHGWDIKPVHLQVSTSDGQQAASQYHLCDAGIWVLYHAGDFTVSNSDDMIKLKFSLMQIDCTHTKGGLCVDSVLICPKDYRHEKEVVVYM